MKLETKDTGLSSGAPPLEPHPAAELWPMLKPDDYAALVDSISRNGLRNPITLHDGMVLDGRNRYQACLDAGVEPRFIQHDGSDPWICVFDQNGERRLGVTNAMKYGIWKKTAARSYEWQAEQERIARQGNERRAEALARRDRNADGTVTGNPYVGDAYARGETDRATAADIAAGAELFANESADERSARKFGSSSSTSGTTTGSINRNKTRAAKATASKTDAGTVAKMDALEKSSPDLHEQVTTGELPLVQAQRLAKERKRQEKRDENASQVAQAPNPAELDGVYSTIVIDPPWDWGDEGDSDQLGRARPDYVTMSGDELMALPVADRAAHDAHLYCWITNRSLPKGFALLDAWGFRYVTMLTWVKPSFGMGNYFRGQTEHVLFGVRGSLPLNRKDVGTVFEAPRGPNGHSSKPIEFYDLLESCSPGPYLEMFSRIERQGWTAWGQNAGVAA